jgi:hypothetical protein
MIGNPFNFQVAWDSILVDTLTMAESDTIVEPPIRWMGGSGYRFDVEILAPFAGYWVKNLGDSPVTLRVPPREAPALTILETPVMLMAGGIDGWSINIIASCAGARDHNNLTGVAQDADICWDRLDRSEPPMSPGSAISLYFPHSSWERHSGNYSSDIRGVYEELEASGLGFALSVDGVWGHMWRFDIAKNFTRDGAADEVLLEFEMLKNIPTEAMLYFIDRHLEKCVDIRSEKTYSFYLGEKDFISTEEEARFVLLVGSEEFIDTQENEVPEVSTQMLLHQNYPNPFNPSTIIRYEISKATDVIISVYDVKGSLVNVIYRGYRDPGNYEVGWNSENGEGIQVTSGIYFYRLVAGDFVQTKKMVLLR